ncbi:hypothetical protein FQN57_003367 [Myotisia sp. PD_48]|nr:hypothetical protein FQN57_003367 [Myotisia sp. PD_48]
MFCRTTATRAVFRAIATPKASIGRCGLVNTVFKAQLTYSRTQSFVPQSPSLAISAYRKPVSTALVRYASTLSKDSLAPRLSKDGIEEEDVDMMAGVRGDMKVIKDTFSLEDVPKEALYLGLAGVVPYLATSLSTVYLSWEMNHAVTTGAGKWISAESAELLMNVIEPLQIGYGAVILSFLGAIHWGLEWAGYGGKLGYRRYAAGVIAPAVAWPTLLFPVEYALISQFFAFTFLYYNDARAAVKGWTPSWYAMYRFVLTFVVGASIVVSLIGREQLASHHESKHGVSDKIKLLRGLSNAEEEESTNEKEIFECAITFARIFTNRGVLAGIPKPWIPIEAGDVGKSARRFILDGLNESSIIAHQVRPRNRSEEDISRANPNPVIPKDDAPRWGLISHLGWIVPGDLDISHLEIEPIIRELPHILEARALSLAPTCQQVVQTTRNVSDHLPDNYIVDLLQRQQNMGLREYLNYLRRLNVIESSHRIHDFIRLYDRSRYSTRPLNEAEFQEMMSLFAEVLEGITTIFDTDITTYSLVRNLPKAGTRQGEKMQSFLQRGISSLSLSTSTFNKRNNDLPVDPDHNTTGKSGTALQSSVSFQRAPTERSLFTAVDPIVDGDECDRDCASCLIRYPAKFNIDLEDKLYGNVNAWSTHILVATGKTDWVRDVADEQGSIMEAIEKGGLEPNNGTLKLSASNIPVPDEYYLHEAGKQPTVVLILPAFTIVDNVTPSLAPDLINYFVNRSPTTTTPIPQPINISAVAKTMGSIRNQGDDNGQGTGHNRQSDSTSTPKDQLSNITRQEKILTPLSSRPCPHAAVILLCSQRTRDARCGQSAPLLRREFERHLRTYGLYRDMNDERPGGVGIYFISHVGGHKYSANVLIYRRRDFGWFRNTRNEQRARKTDTTPEIIGESYQELRETVDEGAAQGIWLARIRPEDCEGIVKFTILRGKVVKPESQLRGGFDREKALTSW